jgi:hypothetical protein
MQPGSTLKNYIFCPGTVFLCFVLFSKKTYYYFPIQHRPTGVITEKECVYSAVGYESLNTSQPNQVSKGP